MAALRHMVDHVTPGGLVLIGQRDWEPSPSSGRISTFVTSILIRPRPAGGPCCLTCGTTTPLWSRSRFSFSLAPLSHSSSTPSEGEAGRGWTTEVFPLRYRMWQRRELVELMEQAGLANVHEVECDWEVRLAGTRG